MASARFAEFADAYATYRYTGVCHGQPGTGETRSAREYAACPEMMTYGIADPLEKPLGTQVADCRAFFYTYRSPIRPK